MEELELLGWACRVSVQGQRQWGKLVPAGEALGEASRLLWAQAHPLTRVDGDPLPSFPSVEWKGVLAGAG